MAARNEGYIPSWLDDALAFGAGFSVRARGPLGTASVGTHTGRDFTRFPRSSLYEKSLELRMRLFT